MNELIDTALLQRFAGIVGPGHALTEAGDTAPFLREWRDKYEGLTPLVLLPGTVEEVSEIVRLACETGTVIVPQGGNTGLVGAQIPDRSNKQILLSLKRLRQQPSISLTDNSMTVGAGMTLQEVQVLAAEHDRLFPVSLASEGTCQIGGAISTNAGGIQVLKYGMMREQVLGLEVVLPDGQIWRKMGNLRKDNTGYDMKQLFIGAEGTLGIITAAALRLYPRRVERQVAFAGCNSLEALARLFEIVSEKAGAALCAFEILPQIGIEMVVKQQAEAGIAHKKPLKDDWPWYGLIELEAQRMGEVAPLLEAAMATAIEDGVAGDAVLSNSEAQRERLWALRDLMSEAQKIEGGSIKHDVSVPVTSIPAFIPAANEVVETMIPGARPVPFGHFGDGNIHYNITQPKGMDRQVFLDHWEELNEAVYAVVLEFGGSISAEHGIGVMKRDLLARVKDPAELALMRAVKAAIDPVGIMNPNALIKI